MNPGRPHRLLIEPASIALASLSLGLLPIGTMVCGHYQAGMCDPGPLLALIWLVLCSMAGSGFAMFSLWRAQSQGRRIALPILAALLNLLAWFIPLWLLVT